MLNLLATLAIVVAVLVARRWWRGHRGLDQWPEPYGRFYTEWLRAPIGAGDYYDWLSARMGHREPWRSWARLDRRLSSPDPLEHNDEFTA